jgi:hypothetical protein
LSGRGLRITALTTVKTAVLPPIASDKSAQAARKNTGFCRNLREAEIRSWAMDVMRHGSALI